VDPHTQNVCAPLQEGGCLCAAGDTVGAAAAGPVGEEPLAVLLVGVAPEVRARFQRALQGMPEAGRGVRLHEVGAVGAALAWLGSRPETALILLAVTEADAAAGFEFIGQVRGALGNRRVRIVLLSVGADYVPPAAALWSGEIDGHWPATAMTAELAAATLSAALRAHRAWQALVAQHTLAAGEAETRYRTLADFTYDWESWIDPSGRWIYCSPACGRISGHPAEAFLADPALFPSIVHPEDRALLADHLNGLAEERGRCEISFRIRLPGGEVRWLEHRCQPVHDAGGRYLGRRASNRDITEGKQTQDALARAKEAAEAANRAKSLFLANMSHELRTPLNAILGFAQILEHDPRLGEEQRREVETIHRAGRHLLELINDVLEISRLEAGRSGVRSVPFDLPQTLAEIERRARVGAQAKGLDFKVEGCGEPCLYVLGDASRLRQVLNNLLDNALKYTEQGGVTLRIQVIGEAPGHLRFEVADTGPGIPAEEQARVFQAFYQTPAGAAHGEGTGLGLTISREFVRLMGGDLRVESAPGRGCCFRFDIPLPAAAPPLAADPGGRVVGLAPGHAPVRILVAEDQAVDRELVCRLLERAGFEVRAVENGRQAVAEFQHWRPHLIWMDMRMPVLDGYRATREIRTLPGGGEVRIVALTGKAFREAILAAGCDDMVTKPVAEEPLFEVMGRLLGLRFRYAETAPPVIASGAEPTGVLRALPAALREPLRVAAGELDVQTLKALVAALGRDHPAAAECAGRMVAEFRFDALLAALDGPP
jgi:PAS domain S-box-containing protein